MIILILHYTLLICMLCTSTITKHTNFSDRLFKAAIIDDQPNQNNQALEDGRNVYVKFCLACHQADGSGVPRMYPPLQNSNWVNGDPDKIITLLLNGMSGEIQVNEEYYDQTMPKFDYLTDTQISDVLTYVRQNFGNKAMSVSLKDVIALRKLK